jgi:heme exporter protein D
MQLGPYAPFILSAYGAAVAIIAALVLWVVLDQRQLRRMLEEAEAKGLTRRSAQPVGGQP